MSSETAISPDVIAAENNAVRGLFGHDNPNPDLGRADDTPPPPANDDSQADAPKLSIREQIAERAKARRREAEEGLTPELEQTDSGEYVPPFMKRPAQEEPANDDDTPPADEAKTYTLKVRGNDVPVASRDELLKLAEVDEDEAGDFTDAQLIKLAQKQMAASAILDEAKQAKKSARMVERADEDDTSPDPSTQDHDDTDPARTEQHQQDEHRKVIEAIQFGDPDEAATALRDYLAKGVTDALTQNEIGRRVNAVESMISQSTVAFEEANSDLVSDPDFADLLYNKHLVAEFKKDLRAAGLPQERIEATLGNHISKAMQAYIAVAADGRVKLRTPDVMLNAAAESLRQKINRPSPNREPARTVATTPANDRLAAKRNLTSQPNRASVPKSTAAPKNGQSPEARSSVVSKMRAQRGQA